MSSAHYVPATRREITLTAAPHRLFFLGGAVQLVAVLLIWLYVLAGWYLPVWPAPALKIVGPSLHVFLMLYGLFTFFVFGFLTTVLPRWLASEAIPRRRYATIAGLFAAAMVCYYIGVFTSRTLAIAGVSLLALGWGGGLLTLFQVWRASAHADKRYALFPFACVTAGWAGCCIHAAWLITQYPLFFHTSIVIGLWLYLLPLIVAISYRMIPFFSSRALGHYTTVKPGWTLPATLACVLLHFALTVSGQAQWVVLADLPLAGIAAWHSLRWGVIRSLRVPLLGMLHMSFAWLTIALLLYSAQSLLRLTGAPFDLGLAPVHALGIGFITGMVIAMASRVSLGHSGRKLIADRVTLWAFAVIQAVAIVRILAEVPPFNHRSTGVRLTLIAGAVWLIASLPWSVRFGSVYVTPRVDGRPGASDRE